jgi:hypothetical protein
MAFIIGGHPRSGTTLLFRLCRDHPQIGITGEFKCFQGLDSPLPEYWRWIETDWRHFSFYWRIGFRAPWFFKVGSGIFLAQYRWRLRRIAGDRVTVSDVERTLQTVLRKKVVGDKYPAYVFALSALVRQPLLKRIIIYRDARDVTSSFLNMVRTKWKGRTWVKEFQTPRDVARQWVRAVEIMEQNKDHLLAIRYEDLVREPRPALRKMAEYLGVDPEGFNTRRVHTESVGKSSKFLRNEEVQGILEVAGPAMERLGYL